jgi:hypothetical protein
MNYSYSNTLTIKSGPSEFEFHGKSNEPNVTFADGKHYISKKIYIHKPSITGYDGELCIEHTTSTNYDVPLLLYFPLKTDQSSPPNAIDRIISSHLGSSLEVNLNAILPQNGHFEYKGKNIAVFTTPIIINTRIVKDNESVIEGAACTIGNTEEEISKLTAQVQKLTNIVNEHTTIEYDTHHPKVGVNGLSFGAGGSGQSNSLESILKNKGIKCTPLPQGDEKDALKLIGMDPANGNSKIDLSIPLAIFIVFIISTGFYFYMIRSVYKLIFRSLYIKNDSIVDERMLERMHMYEGVFGFILFYLSMLFVIPSKFSSRIAASILLITWIIYAVTIEMSRKKLIGEVIGTSDDNIQTVMGSVLSNVFRFYPLYFIFLPMYIYKLNRFTT